MTTCVDPNSRVLPSGAARATASVPIDFGRARAVLDHQRQAVGLAEVVRHQTRHQVVDAGRRRRNDRPDRSPGLGLRLVQRWRDGQDAENGSGGCQMAEDSDAGISWHSSQRWRVLRSVLLQQPREPHRDHRRLAVADALEPAPQRRLDLRRIGDVLAVGAGGLRLLGEVDRRIEIAAVVVRPSRCSCPCRRRC